jgi:hypothetical protein
MLSEQNKLTTNIGKFTKTQRYWWSINITVLAIPFIQLL